MSTRVEIILKLLAPATQDQTREIIKRAWPANADLLKMSDGDFADVLTRIRKLLKEFGYENNTNGNHGN